MKRKPKSRGTRQRDDRQRGNSNDRGYGHRWRKAREAFLRQHFSKGDGLCAICKTELGELGPRQVVVDHITPHKGDYHLLWSRSNWQAVCKPCHDHKTWQENH